MTITCSECGCPYDSNTAYCPECGNPTPAVFENHTGITNCPNCGAPVTNNIACEYCGSTFPKEASRQGGRNNPGGYDDDDRSSGSGSALGAGVAAFIGGIAGSLLGSD